MSWRGWPVASDRIGPLDNNSAVEAFIWKNIRLGYMELVGVGEDGELMYRITPAGEARVEAMRRGDDE